MRNMAVALSPKGPGGMLDMLTAVGEGLLVAPATAAAAHFEILLRSQLRYARVNGTFVAQMISQEFVVSGNK